MSRLQVLHTGTNGMLFIVFTCIVWMIAGRIEWEDEIEFSYASYHLNPEALVQNHRSHQADAHNSRNRQGDGSGSII